jgi:hypothetical protein
MVIGGKLGEKKGRGQDKPQMSAHLIAGCPARRWYLDLSQIRKASIFPFMQR